MQLDLLVIFLVVFDYVVVGYFTYLSDVAVVINMQTRLFLQVRFCLFIYMTRDESICYYL